VIQREARARTVRGRELSHRTVGITIYGCERDEAALCHELAPRLGVAPTVTGAALSAATVGLARGNRCISISHKARVAHGTLRALGDAGVTYISTRSAGHDHVDVRYAESLGIRVETVAYSPDGVADYTLMLMLMALRHVRTVSRRVDVHDYRLGDAPGRELRDLTVGVIGAGRIGGAVIERLQGFGCRIVTCDTRCSGSGDDVTLGALLEQSDVVTLHTPLSAETHHLLDRRRIAQLRHGAVIVNTGRGGLVDTAALAAALERGRLGGAALDVLEGEEGIFYTDCRERPIEHSLLLRLHRLPNVLLSPHIAYYTERALRETVERSLRNCLAFTTGGPHG
jgi:D-specific alpha-keto acid dehydrogenase